MTRFDDWASYFYPPPDDAVMRNIPGIRDVAALRVVEYRVTQLRGDQLAQNPSLVVRSFDAAHVRGIHRHLFQDVYEWAGEYRSVNMAKGRGPGFADVHTGEVDRYLGDVHRLVSGTQWAGLDRGGFARAAAGVFAHLNQAHPFREGNGRASKVFMQDVAGLSRFRLDYALVSPQEWNTASMLSGPDLGSYEVVPDSLVPVFERIAVERAASGGVAPAADSGPVRASFPQAPSPVARNPGRQGPVAGARAARGMSQGRPERGAEGPGAGR